MSGRGKRETKEKTMKKMTREQLVEALAKAMNLLNDVDRDEWTNRQLGEYHTLARLMPEKCDYANNGNVFGKDL